jgi:cell division initiation protein
MLTPHDIEEYPLPKTLGGYKCEAVDAFLDTVAADYQKLYDENLALTKKLNLLVEKITEYRKDEEYLKSAMLEAQRLVEISTKDAKAKAEEILTEANAKAEEIIQNAVHASQAADEHYESMRVEVNNFRNQLLTTYKSHIEIISALPVYEKEEQEVEDTEVVEEPVEEVVEEEVPAAEETAEELDIPEAVADVEEPVGDMSDIAAAIDDMDTVTVEAETDYDTVNFDA